MNHDSELARCPTGPGWMADISQWQYPSTSIVFGAISIESFVATALVLCCWTGVRTFTSVRTPLISFRQKEVRPDTDNKMWAYFMFLSGLTSLIDCLEAALFPGDNHTSTKVATLIGRVLFGATTVALTFALNHHRKHRHRNFREEDIGPLIERQVKRVNWFTVAVYAAYVASEGITSAVIPDTHRLQTAFFWLFIVTIVLVNLPSLFCGLWVAIHAGELRPSPVARVLLVAGLVLRLIGSFPANFWNDHVIPNWYNQDGCPIGSVLSFFDFVVLLKILGLAFMTIFVGLEHRRNSLVHLQERMEEIADAIDDVASCGNVSADFSNHSLQR